MDLTLINIQSESNKVICLEAHLSLSPTPPNRVFTILPTNIYFYASLCLAPEPSSKQQKRPAKAWTDVMLCPNSERRSEPARPGWMEGFRKSPQNPEIRMSVLTSPMYWEYSTRARAIAPFPTRFGEILLLLSSLMILLQWRESHHCDLCHTVSSISYARSEIVALQVRWNLC